ncbi:hypothetical protein AB0F18_24840 [Streptomyces sp. NPDC029216]|uniref:hypothetical protein n=1 Tax=Streptomyces sp. NPDC029216 TaxID=3154701 RepID=UPI0033FC6CEA
MPTDGVTSRPATSRQVSGPHRLSLPYGAAQVTFPVLGTLLALDGMPTSRIIPLLAGCAALGVAHVVIAGGGRRLAAGLASAVLRITQ